MNISSYRKKARARLLRFIEANPTLTIADVASLVGCHANSVRKWVDGVYPRDSACIAINEALNALADAEGGPAAACPFTTAELWSLVQAYRAGEVKGPFDEAAVLAAHHRRQA